MSKELSKKLYEMQQNMPSLSGSDKDKCFFCDCESNSIKSHSISKKKVLALLESQIKNGGIGIYYLEDVPDVDFKEDKSISSFKKVNRRLYKDGKDTISTFYGFCSDCDASVFLPLDRYDYQNNRQINFLHALRTQAYQLTQERNIFLHIKNNIISLMYEADGEMNKLDGFPKMIADYLTHIPDNADVTWDMAKDITSLLGQSANLPIKRIREEVDMNQRNTLATLANPSSYPMIGAIYKNEIKKVLIIFNQTMGTYKSTPTYVFESEIDVQISRVENEIKHLTQFYRSSNFETHSYQCIPIQGVFLIAGAFTYRLNNESIITLTFFPEESTNRTYFVFSEQKDPSSNSLYLSILNLKSENEFRMVASDIILSVGSNVFLSPKYYEKLPQEVKDLLVRDKTELKEIGFNLFSNDYLN